jgi:hypothetical protein
VSTVVFTRTAQGLAPETLRGICSAHEPLSYQMLDRRARAHAVGCVQATSGRRQLYCDAIADYLHTRATS